MSVHKFTKQMNENSIKNFYTDMAAGHVKEVESAYFSESGVQSYFYRIFGEVVKIVLNTNIKQVSGFFIAGDDLEMFEASYGKR